MEHDIQKPEPFFLLCSFVFRLREKERKKGRERETEFDVTGCKAKYKKTRPALSQFKSLKIRSSVNSMYLRNVLLRIFKLLSCERVGRGGSRDSRPRNRTGTKLKSLNSARRWAFSDYHENKYFGIDRRREFVVYIQFRFPLVFVLFKTLKQDFIKIKIIYIVGLDELCMFYFADAIRAHLNGIVYMYKKRLKGVKSGSRKILCLASRLHSDYFDKTIIIDISGQGMS